MGLDLYKGDAQTSKQVALLNSGIEVQLSEKAVSSLAYLNGVASKVSLETKDLSKAPIVKEETATDERKVIQFPRLNTLLQTLNTGHDKNGSNPFYPGNIAKSKKKVEEEDT